MGWGGSLVIPALEPDPGLSQVGGRKQLLAVPEGRPDGGPRASLSRS